MLRTAQLYSLFYWYIHCRYGYNIKGMGFFLRQLKSEYIFNVNGVSICFSKEIPGAYARIITGNFNEPETHLFIKKIISKIDSEMTFIDVGSNIGEFILDAARYEKVEKVIGFEPDPRAARVCRKSILKNNFGNISVIEKIVNSDGLPSRFVLDSSSTGSKIAAEKDSDSVLLEATTLDLEFLYPIGSAIVLIDVEGAEALVLQGGEKFINRDKPLIIFEYNHLSQRFFSLNDIRSILGSNYEIFRLRNDGFLDADLTKTWNCVAINRQSIFHQLVEIIAKE